MFVVGLMLFGFRDLLLWLFGSLFVALCLCLSGFGV